MIDGSNGSVNVLVGSGASGHYFDIVIIPGLRDILHNYKASASQQYIATSGGRQLKGAGQGLLRVHIIDAQEVQHLLQVSMLVVPIGVAINPLDKTAPTSLMS